MNKNGSIKIGTFLIVLICLAFLSGCGKQDQDLIDTGYEAIESADYDTAIQCFTDALEEGAGERLSYRGLGIAYLGNSAYPEAVKNLETALLYGGFMPDKLDYDINFYLATAYYKNGSIAKALEVCDAILELSPKNRDAMYLRGSIRLKLGDYERACEDFEKCIELAPSDMETLISISELLTRSGYKQIALDYLEAAMGRTDSKSMSDFDRGRICYYEEDYENAKTYLEKARDSSNPATALFLGRTYEALGDYNYASSVYTSYLTGDTSNAEIYNQLGLCRMHQGLFEDAAQAFESGLSVGDSNCRQELMFNQIVANEELAEFEKARGLMEEYLKLYPDDVTAQREYIFLKSR